MTTTEPGLVPDGRTDGEGRSGRVLAAALAAGLALDVAAHAGGVGVAVAVALAAPAAVLLRMRPGLPNGAARFLVSAAVVFAVWLALRTSPWLLVPDVLAVVSLLWLGASFGCAGDPLDLTVPSAVHRGLVAAWNLAAGVTVFRWRPRRSGRDRSTAVLRGLVLAAPLVLILGLLLASADVVFAHLFSLHVPSGPLVWHLVVIVAGAWTVGGLLRLASSRVDAPSPLQPALGATEASVVLTSLVALFGVFAAAQAWAASSGGRHVIETEGLTYAAYARQGFFQLLAVAAITLAALLGLRAVTDLSDAAWQRRFRRLALAASALTLVIVAVAFRRLWLYQRAYALTMLRLSAGVAIVWIGIVFVLLATTFVGWLPPRRLVAAASMVALVILIGLDVANPEAVVVRQNVSRYEHTGRLDVDYLVGMSDDAVPALVAALPRLAPDVREQVLVGLGCDAPPASRSFLAFNAARARAEADVRAACRAR